MLNCTSRKQVDQVREKFFSLYPEPSDAITADPDEMANLISILGFKNKRTNIIKRFSDNWVNQEWLEPAELYGIGKYGQDSWEIFQKGNLDVIPTDGVLNTYLEWARSQDEKPV
jgi:methyl-CpG-binding domain protein 4